MIQTNHWTGESARAILLAMIAQPYQLYVERRDPRRNMARFYALSIEETLFGQARPWWQSPMQGGHSGKSPCPVGNVSSKSGCLVRMKCLTC